MKCIVVQHGARHGYAVPAILEQAGMLERFYTDVCADVGLGRWLAAGRHFPGVGRKIQRLMERRLPPEIVCKTRTFIAPLLRHAARAMFGGKNDASQFREHLRWSRDWGNAMTRAGVGGATHVFSMLGEGGPFLLAAKQRGLKVISEFYTLMRLERIVSEERARFPGWEPDPPDYELVRREFPDSDAVLTQTDFAICPSEVVRQDLAEHFGIPPERSAVVPYGVSRKWLDLEPRPQRGRILFVGAANLNKGIHYYAAAASLLKKFDFRVAGSVRPEVARRPECRHLKFLGRIPRERIHEEFQAADIFVLPSLAEGSSEATYEALAAGVPMITTRAAGSVARDGIEGLIVPERDAVALAAAIESLVEDRDLRNRMAAAARQRAREFTWEKYGERLIAALFSLCP